jgi:hypothetical protein
LISVIILAVNEYFQVEMDGPGAYFDDNFNKLDFFMILVMICAAVTRLIKPQKILPSVYLRSEMDGEVYSEQYLFYLIPLNFFLMFALLGKCLFFLRAFPAFGMLVELVLGIRTNLIPFILFFMLTNLFFASIFAIMGATWNPKTNIWTGFNNFMHVFLNADGVMPSPIYPFWDHKLEADEHASEASVIIYTIWMIWFIQ